MANGHIDMALGVVRAAIVLHKKHMDDPKTATPKSQKLLMEQLEKIKMHLESN